MYEQLSGEATRPDNLLYSLLLTLFLQAAALLHAFLSLCIPHSKNSQPSCHYCSIFPAVFFAPLAFALLSALFAACASCCPLPSPFFCSSSTLLALLHPQDKMAGLQKQMSFMEVTFMVKDV